MHERTKRHLDDAIRSLDLGNEDTLVIEFSPQYRDWAAYVSARARDHGAATLFYEFGVQEEDAELARKATALISFTAAERRPLTEYLRTIVIYKKASILDPEQIAR